MLGVGSLGAGRDTEAVQVGWANARRPQVQLLNVGCEKRGLTVF